MKRLLPFMLALAVSPAAHAAPDATTAPATDVPATDAPATPAADAATAPAAPAAAPSTVDPTAKALLAESAAAYGALKGLSMKYTATDQSDEKASGQSLSGLIAYSKPGLAKVEIKDATDSVLNLSDGKKLYSQVDAHTFQGTPIAANESLDAILQRVPSALSVFLPALAGGHSPLESPSMSGAIVKLLPDNGLSISAPTGPGGPVIVFSLFIDPTDHLLRRVEATISYKGKKSVNMTTLTDIKTDPAFSDTDFKFTPGPGVKVVAEVPMYDARLKVGAAPYALKGKDLTGKTHTWSEFKGKVVLLDFWATWCGPCVGELPNVLANYKTYHSKGFDIIGVSLDEEKKALTDFIKARNLTYPNLYDGKGWKNVDSTAYGVRAIPFSLLIGKDGKIVAVNPRGPLLEPAIKKALAVKTVAAKPATVKPAAAKSAGSKPVK